MLVAALLCYAGFGCLCLAMDRHHQDVLGRKPGRPLQVVLRVVAALLWLVALAQVMGDAGWAIGLAQGVGLAMASAGMLVGLLSYWPRLALGLAALAIPGALVAGLITPYV
ncbi:MULTISPECIES: DUF3325 domain-containing protein [Pseudomonas]|uniref:DUF3325 domain-containing protein n=1 Tax=Pseudomonas quercus TaxID=2722792 RepID=A0ABX0YDT0_9PSED|nr:MULTISPECIES: DUF3325 domain-containing protein [Pseudomonas]MBF7141874.1 DUF3325 domain-containing protein [Pseudomonas sp. LY10J]NJP00412.1 DUF3325 domain-containing protein [Pseudomonas quercus]